MVPAVFLFLLFCALRAQKSKNKKKGKYHSAEGYAGIRYATA
jgi:hypothetical protein